MDRIEAEEKSLYVTTHPSTARRVVREHVPALVAEVRRQRARIRQLEDIVQWALDEGGWRLIYYSDPPPHDLVDTSDMFGGSEVKRYDAALASAGDAGREGA